MVFIWNRRRRTSLEEVRASRESVEGAKHDTQRVRKGLRDSTRYSTGQQFPRGTGTLLAFVGKVFSDRFVHHEVKTDLQVDDVSFDRGTSHGVRNNSHMARRQQQWE